MTRRTRSGAAAVELAVVLPFLALMFAVVLDFARVFRATQTLQTAATVGASYATGDSWADRTTTPPADAARAAAVAAGANLNPPLRADQVSVSIDATTATVTVSYEFPLLTGFLYSGGVQLQRTATARVAPRPCE